MIRTVQMQRLLWWLAHRQNRFSVKQLSQAVNLSKSSCQRWLCTLVPSYVKDLTPDKCHHKWYRVTDHQSLLMMRDGEMKEPVSSRNKSKPTTSTNKEDSFKVSFHAFRAGERFKVTLKVSAANYNAAINKAKEQYPDAMFEGGSVVQA